MHTSTPSTTPRGTRSRRGRIPHFSSSTLRQPSTSATPAGTTDAAPTFFSCLSIPIESASPIEQEADGDTSRRGRSPHLSSPNSPQPSTSATPAGTTDAATNFFSCFSTPRLSRKKTPMIHSQQNLHRPPPRIISHLAD